MRRLKACATAEWRRQDWKDNFFPEYFYLLLSGGHVGGSVCNRQRFCALQQIAVSMNFVPTVYP